MPPQELSPRWRGKHGFQVGFFPGECVELINGKIPESLINSVPKPVPKKRGKLLTFLRSVVKARPKQPKEREVEKERVFGRDLGEHLLHSGRDVPQVLQSCAEFIEQHGVVQGIYPLSGVASSVQRLHQEFESEQVPELTVRDVHSASSLCKMYFRELPNPLLTDQLYDKFSDAVGATTEEERLVRMRDAIQQLPAPHYRVLEFLMRHLACLSANSSVTNMHAKNLAIVWAPNLLRSQQSESACASGRAACTELQMQSAVVEFIIDHTEVLFCSTSGPDIADGAGHSSLSGPKSVQASSPATELLTLEEAQARRRGHSSSPVVVTQSRDIEVEEGPAAVRGKFHTVIDFPSESDGERELIQVQALISPSSAEDADLSPPDTTGTSLDCDPVPLQCSPAQAQSKCPDSSTSVLEQVSITEEKPSLLEGSLESGLQSQAPGSGSESSP
ncbi:rho GTPase-activating protein 32-like [Lagopus leucura]|uniref:rho GTPase-activating protein 32-like n=1 Tax=Lagopus leucura TaxID=30410 RepID=UPI001C66DC8B|nr:rho GTPase-activating protein 32-like [Lagopus leucura]